MDYEICKTFEEINLSEELIYGISIYDFEKPTEIQKKGILPIIDDIMLL